MIFSIDFRRPYGYGIYNLKNLLKDNYLNEIIIEIYYCKEESIFPFMFECFKYN